MANKAINDLLKYGTRLLQLPVYASAAEALSGKNGIKVTAGSNLYSHLGPVVETEAELTSPQTFIFELDFPAILYKHDYVNGWHNDWWSPKPLSNIYGSNDGTTWIPITFNYTQTNSYCPSGYYCFYLYMDQVVNNTSAYKKYKVYLDGSGDTAGFAKLNLYFRQV